MILLRNVEKLSSRLTQCKAGITARRAAGAAELRIRKKQMPSCNETDRACNMAQAKISISEDAEK